MNINHTIILLGLFLVIGLAPPSSFAQTVSGVITNKQAELLTGATVYWAGTTQEVTTNETGEFTISSEGMDLNKVLVASFVGYKADSVSLTDENYIVFVLKPSAALEEVVVKGDRPGFLISDKLAIKTEQITEVELKKAACCDLAGCFETQVTVQPQTTNIITNSKELRILGLSGVYNQVLVDGFPMIQGLSYTYGISSIPGTLVRNIYVAKGANSVLQGYESISGQINVLLKEADNTDRLLLNGYLNSFGEKQLNANYAFQQGKWSNLTAIHTTQPAQKRDRDEDTFLDLPLLSRYSLFNKTKYGNEQENGWFTSVNFRLLHEERIGGQVNFDPQIDRGSSEVYGQTVEFNQTDVWTKTAYRFNAQHRIALFLSGFHQDQRSFFGTTDYFGHQLNFYTNLQYEWDYSPKHDLKTGLSFRHQELHEDIAFTANTLDRTYAGHYNKLEQIPGVFAENTMQLLDNQLTWIAGVRGDYHPEFGFKVTPRSLVKYTISPKTTLRASIGKGWRTVNLFSENINLLVSSRDIILEEALQPEEAINWGLNLTHKFEQADFSGYLSADYYRTDFQNQIFPDYDSQPTVAIIKNFTGTSISNGLQLEGLISMWQQVEVKLGYNYLDVFRKVDEERIALPFNSNHRFLTAFSYKPLNEKFHWDFNVHWFGKQRLPHTHHLPSEFQRPHYSDPYTTLNTQFTYNFKRFDVYCGAENIFDFRQERPIVSWENPFGPYFDTASVWGPTRGREIYVGFRFALKE